MRFEQVLADIKAGKPVSREDWNGSKTITRNENNGDWITTNPAGDDGTNVWNPSQEDILAEDWYVAGQAPTSDGSNDGDLTVPSPDRVAEEQRDRIEDEAKRDGVELPEHDDVQTAQRDESSADPQVDGDQGKTGEADGSDSDDTNKDSEVAGDDTDQNDDGSEKVSVRKGSN